MADPLLPRTVRPHSSRLRALGYTLVGLAVGVAGVTFMGSSSQAATPACPGRSAFTSPEPSGDPVPVTGPATEQVIELGNPEKAGIADLDMLFKRSGDAAIPSGSLEFAAGTFRRGRSRIPRDAVVVTVSRRTREGVEVNLCIDPGQAGTIAPGTYTGTVQVADTRLVGMDVPVKVTVQSPATNLMGILGIPAAAVLGVLGIWLTERRASGKSFVGTAARAEFRSWLVVNGILALVVASIAAWTIWSSRAAANPSFGVSGNDFVTLIGTMVGAAYSTGGLTSAAAGQRKPAG